MHLQGTGGEKKLNMHYKILDLDTLEISNLKEKEKWMMTIRGGKLMDGLKQVMASCTECRSQMDYYAHVNQTRVPTPFGRGFRQGHITYDILLRSCKNCYENIDCT